MLNWRMQTRALRRTPLRASVTFVTLVLGTASGIAVLDRYGTLWAALLVLATVASVRVVAARLSERDLAERAALQVGDMGAEA